MPAKKLPATPPFAKSRARMEIIWYMVQFNLTSVYMDGAKRRNFPGLHGFFHDEENHRAQVGDLVALKSIPMSKFYLGWLREIEPRGSDHDARYLIESIEDGALCWWSNVGVTFYDRDELVTHPQWTWDDRQFAFKDKWFRLCYREKDAYITLPLFPEFGAGFEVTLGTRTRFGNDSGHPKRTYPDYRKVTKAMMAELFDEASAVSKAA